MKKILLVICLLVFSSPIVNAQAVGFKDVPTNFWAVQEISWAQETNLVKGYSNGTFRPNNTLTEAQLLVIIMNYFQLEQETVTPSEHWADGLYKTAEKYNLPLEGYHSHKIREAAVSRGVLAQVLAQTQGINSELENAVNWMFDEGITTGRLKNKKTRLEQYDPAGNMTRAQTAVFFKRISDLGINEYVFPDDTNDEEPTIPWRDNRIPLDIPLFQSGDAYFPAYDKKAVQPTVLNWNGVSRFEGPKEFKSLWSLSFDYDRSPHTLTTLSNLPVIGSDGTLYIQEGYLYSSSNLGYLYAIHTTGKLLWKQQIGTSNSVPVIGEEGIIYAVGDDYIFAFYPNGTIKWKKDLNGYNGTLALGKNGTILVSSRNAKGDGCQLVAYDQDGKIKWTFDDFHSTSNSLGSASPVVANDGTIFIFDEWGYLYAITDSGTLQWKVKTKANTGTISLGDDGTIYIAAEYVTELDYITNGAIFAISPHGTLLWENHDIEPTNHTKIIIDSSGLLFVAGHYRIAALNTEGQMVWEYYNEEDFGKASMVADKNGKLYVAWQLYNGMDEIMVFNQDGNVIKRNKFFNEEDEFDSGLLIGHDHSIYLSVAHYDYNKLYKLGE